MVVSFLPRSSLGQRLVSAVIGVLITAAICVWGEWPFVGFTVFLALVARYEITRAYAQLGIQPNGLLSFLGAMAPASVMLLRSPFGAGTPSAPLSALLILACILIAASLWETGRASRTSMIHTGRNMAYGLLCGVYISLFAGVALLRISSWNGPAGALPGLDDGARLVFLTAACTMAGDSMAFFVGSALGRHKLAEVLSPKKSIEGLAAGVAASIITGCAAGGLLLGSVRFGFIVGAAAGILGPLGDLFKSALKREIGIKDFGSFIPGHGGVLDRFDSLLFTAPVVALLLPTYQAW